MKINKMILQQAMNKWGFFSQISMLREECLELALSIGKFYERDRSMENWENVIDEMADVSIMLEQIILDPVLKTQIQERVDFKMKRLEKRIKQ